MVLSNVRPSACSGLLSTYNIYLYVMNKYYDNRALITFRLPKIYFVASDYLFFFFQAEDGIRDLTLEFRRVLFRSPPARPAVGPVGGGRFADAAARVALGRKTSPGGTRLAIAGRAGGVDSGRPGLP